jgi:methylthioribose-1-phosphate isomerase
LPLRIKSVRQLIEAIKTLRVRGAPALGAAGGYGIALAAELSGASNALELMGELENAADMIKGSRPTAINLSWGVDRALRAAALEETAEEIRVAALREAEEIAEEDIPSTSSLERMELSFWITAIMSSPTAMPEGWPAWAGARLWASSAQPLPQASTSMSTPARPGRCTRAHA